MKTLDITKRIFANPTAPFREAWVLKTIRDILDELNTPYVTDSWGNIICGVKSLRELKRSRRVAVVAHTDHPGFHLLKPENKKGLWRAKWHGGCPPDIFKSALAIHHPLFPGQKVRGVCMSRKLDKKKEFLIQIKPSKNAPQLDPSCFGAFDYPGFKKVKSKIITRAADDLAGVVIILATLARLNKKEKKNFLGIFSRAEEVGFVGALGCIFDEYLGKENKIISLEASSQRPGARVGKGPIVRLGDRSTLFDTEMISLLDLAAKKIPHQRRIMDGGSCEATAFNAFGIKAAGLAVPLGNYHNQKSNNKPGPEFIDARDLEAAVNLCTQFYKNLCTTKSPGDTLRKNLKKRFKQYHSLMKGAPDFEL